MTDPTTLPTYGAVRFAYVMGRDRQYRRETRGIPTAEQRADWVAEFDAWVNAIREAAWAETVSAIWATPLHAPQPDNPYRKD